MMRWLAIGLTACTSSDSLVDLADVKLVAAIDDTRVQVDFSDPENRPDDDNHCPVVTGLHGTVGGIPFEQASTGGWHQRGTEYERCDSPGLAVTLATRPVDLDVVVGDDTRQLRVRFESIDTPRAMTVLGPTSMFAPGASVTVVWSHATDDLTSLPLFLRTPGSGQKTIDVLPSVTGDQLSFTMPDVPAGTYELVAGDWRYGFDLPFATCTAEACLMVFIDRLGVPLPYPTITLVVGS